LLVLLTIAAPAQTAAPQVSETVANELGKLRELTEAKSYAPALALIDRLLGSVGAESYDHALLSQIKAQIHLTEGNYAAVIAPLEDALRLGERLGFLPESAQRESMFLLAQLYQQQASEAKDTDLQRTRLDQATAYLRRWQLRTPKPTPEGQLFAASLYYQQATLDPNHPDASALREAQRQAEEGLVLQLKPPTALYLLILSSLQQRDEHAQASEILELLVGKNPENVSYWQQLTSTYLTLAGTAKNEREIERNNLRALLTLERAQARGLLNSPKENFNLVALYLALHQFDPAIAFLEGGLIEGRLENTRGNWELLANSYQQTNRDPQAIAVIEKAIGRLPDDGQLEFTLAQLLYAGTRLAEARDHLERAVKKGSLEKPGQTRLFLAYTAYELQDYDSALRWARDAAAFKDVNQDDLARLTKTIDETIRARAIRSKS
jgi:tetratricopeptide (TPR) repeat protein